MKSVTVNILELSRINLNKKNEMIIPFNEIENSNFDIYCLGGKSIFRHNVYQFARDTHGNIWSHLYRKMLVDVLCEGDEKNSR
jgi:hypothetical protein